MKSENEHATDAALSSSYGANRGWYEGENEKISLSELRAAAYRQKWVIAAFSIIGLVTGVIVTALIPRAFEATSVVQFQQVPKLLEAQSAVDPTLDDRDFERQILASASVARSRDLAQRVATRLQLHKELRFLKAVGVDKASSPDELIEELRDHLSANALPNADSLTLTFTTEDPDVSALLANSYAENLLALRIERQYDASAHAREFLAREVDEAAAQLALTEQAANSYARRAGIVQSYGIEGSSPTSLDASSLEQMNTNLTSARAERIRAEERWRQASSTPLMSIVDVQSNGVIQGLLAQKAGLRAELARLERDFRDGYPTVARLKAQIRQIDDEVRSIAGQIRSSLQDQFLTAQRQEASLASNLRGLRTQALDEQSGIAQLDKLNRQATADRLLYNSLLERYQQVSAAAGVTPNNMVIAERAAPPNEPSVPNIGVYIIGALAAGFMVGASVAFLRELADNPVRTPEDVLNKLKLPLLGATPLAKDVQGAYWELKQSSSPLAESYHSIRSALDYPTGSPPRSIVITSSRAGEGKSTTAVAIALDYASVEQRVLLIDGDLRRPQLHHFFESDNECGFADVLKGDASLSSVIQSHGSIHLLPSGIPSANPAQLLTDRNLQILIEEAELNYDVIIFDGPPVMALADAPLLARSVQATVLVVASGENEQKQIESAIRRLQECRSALVGVILTKFDPRTAGYGSDYASDYTYERSL